MEALDVKTGMWKITRGCCFSKNRDILRPYFALSIIDKVETEENWLQRLFTPKLIINRILVLRHIFTFGFKIFSKNQRIYLFLCLDIILKTGFMVILKK